MKIVFCLRLLAHLENNNNKREGGWKEGNPRQQQKNRTELH